MTKTQKTSGDNPPGLNLAATSILIEPAPFKTKDYISVGHLTTGMYLLRVDSHTLRFFKK